MHFEGFLERSVSTIAVVDLARPNFLTFCEKRGGVFFECMGIGRYLGVLEK